MRIGPWIIRRRVLVAGLTGAIAVAAGSLWMQRTQTASAAAGPLAQPFLRVGNRSDGNLLQEQAIYSDPTPLFFPTPQNYGQGRVVAALQRQPGEEFKNFEPSYQFPEQKLATYGLESEVLPSRPEEILGRGDLTPFAGFGEENQTFENLHARRAFVSVKSLMNGEIDIKRSLDDIALPDSEFSPVEYLVTVVPGGLVGTPLLTTSSGSEEVDNLVRDYLVKTLRIGALLEPGKYAVSFGP